MRNRSSALLATALGLVLLAAPLQAQTPPPASPSPAAPPEKIDPGPVRPDNPAPPDTSGTAPGAAEAAEAPDPLGVAANVSAVRLSGTWETADGKGFSRVVGVVDGGRQRLYVQWLTEPDGGIFETKELDDPEAARLTFGDIRAEPGETGVTMFLDTPPDKDGIRDTWVLIVGAPGETRFGPATN